MATQFEFRLVDGTAPEGELEADQLLAIVQSLKEIATKLGRAATDAEPVGRPPKRTRKVARLTIGLAPGSTRLLARRVDDDDALDFDLHEEEAFDEKFEAIIDSIASDDRPDWVTDTMAVAAGELRNALERAAPIVEFKVGGQVRRTFATSATRKETWRVGEVEPGIETTTFVGRLRVVNLDTHRLQVTDDVGNKVALPNVANDEEVGSLLGQYVSVTGTPEWDGNRRLTQIHEAVIESAGPVPAEMGSRPVVAIEDILSSAPGAQPGGIPGLTSDEAEAYLKAIGL